MPELNDWNTKIIEEFRANEGRVGGPFEGAPMVLLTTTGAKTGKTRVNPMVYRVEEGTIYVFASKAGAPTNPDWYHNLVANPKVKAEIGTETFEATARVITGSDRDGVYARQVEAYPGFGEYQKKTTRIIPVVALDRG